MQHLLFVIVVESSCMHLKASYLSNTDEFWSKHGKFDLNKTMKSSVAIKLSGEEEKRDYQLPVQITYLFHRTGMKNGLHQCQPK
jgi:hypothetical protein